MTKGTPRTASAPRPLIFLLLEASGGLDREVLDQALIGMTEQHLAPEEALIATKKVSSAEIAERYAEHFLMDLMPLPVPEQQSLQQLASLFPEKFCRDNRLVGLERQSDCLHIAIADPTRVHILDQLNLLLGVPTRIMVGPLDQIHLALNRMYGERDVVKEMASELEVDPGDAELDEKSTVIDLDEDVGPDASNQVVRLVNQILRGAILDGASDIHLEPAPDELRVRFRIDGALTDITPVPKASALALISRIKILAKLDIAEKRVPQDGAIQVLQRGRSIDFRISTVPVIWGEKVVIRILNKEAVSLELSTLGFNDQQQAGFKWAAECSHGLIYVTGPTGSGKSTTLYATLTLIRSPTKNLLTVEDPVEYKLPGINQTQVKPAVGLDFARALRAFLRQDPDVIMVGEVRDAETAQICLRAALTGHLVLSTIHTNDALSTISRLVDLGMEPFMLASAIRLIEAQRLVRKLCALCREPYPPTPAMQESFGLGPDSLLFRPVGCEACRKSGYKGRIGIFEVVPFNAALSRLVQDKAPLPALREQGKRDGVVFLAEHGLERALSGITSLEEVHRVTIAED